MGWVFAGAAALLAVTGMGGLIAIAVRRGRDEAEFAAWARRSGWTYQPARQDLAHRFLGEPFQRLDGPLAVGNRAGAVHAVTGERAGLPALAFEYRVMHDNLGGGAAPGTRRYRIAAVRLPAGLPVLEVVPVGDVAASGPRPGLPLPRRFAAAFTVRTNDPRFAADVLQPPLMGWLLSASGPVVLPFRFEGADLLCWQDGGIDASWPEPATAYLAGILEQVPRRVWTG
jgi:hypothetical protein